MDIACRCPCDGRPAPWLRLSIVAPPSRRPRCGPLRVRFSCWRLHGDERGDAARLEPWAARKRRPSTRPPARRRVWRQARPKDLFRKTGRLKPAGDLRTSRVKPRSEPRVQGSTQKRAWLSAYQSLPNNLGLKNPGPEKESTQRGEGSINSSPSQKYVQRLKGRPAQPGVL